MTTHQKLTPTPSPAVAQVKPGWKTSEFYVTAFTIIGLATSSVAASLSPKWAAISAAVTAASYAFSRGLAKLFPPKPA